MPAANDILAGLHLAANDAWWLAVAWHVLAAVLLAALWRGWRPRVALLGALLALPLASVAVLALAVARNPFNALAFGALAAGSWLTVARASSPFSKPSVAAAIAGGTLVTFGWTYPHFLDAPAVAYLAAAPLGLVPCPTLSAVIGIGLLCGGLGSRAWSWLLGAAGVFYGAVGLFRLGVDIDAVLLVGGLALLLSTACSRRAQPRDN